MRRGYLDFTGEFAQAVGLEWLPRSWRVIGSLMSPTKGVVRLVLENDHLDDGPDAVLTCEVHDTPFERRIVIMVDGEPVPPPAPARYFLGADDSGHRYAVPVERRGEFYSWVENPDADDAPTWARRIDGRFTFTDPQQ